MKIIKREIMPNGTIIQLEDWSEASRELETFFRGGYYLIYGTFGGWRGRQAAGKVISGFDGLAGAWLATLDG